MILRLLHLVASLFRRGVACLRDRNRATAQPVSTRTRTAREPEGTAKLPTSGQPVSNGGDQACEQKPGGAQESQEHALGSPGSTEARMPTETIVAPGHGRAEGERDTSSQSSIEPAEEKGSPFQPPPQPPASLPAGEPKRSHDEMPPNTVVPSPALPVKPVDALESGHARDAAPHASQRPSEPQWGRGKERDRHICPEKRGGRPRSDGSVGGRQGQAGTRAQTPRPEIVCRKQLREWIIGVEIPEDILQDGLVTVFQNGASLEASTRGFYPLAALSKDVRIEVNDGGVTPLSSEIPLGDDDWLLFKLSGEQLKQGRRVEQVSSGFYLAIVPEDWERDEERAGSPPVAPEAVVLEGYQAHFFDVADSSSSCIAFREPNGKSVVIGSPGAQFCLVGEQIPDASERIGPLFGAKPPRVKILNADWSKVRTIVIGDEGSGEHRWRKSFEPDPSQEEQELPPEVMERLAGWYFLRFYDDNEDLIDSLDFRFVAGLRGISVPKADPMPDRDGHAQQRVDIFHDAEYTVTLLDPNDPDVLVERCAKGTIVRIPPKAECDETCWAICPLDGRGQDVKLTILIKRVWWALGADHEEPKHWQDRPIEVTREYFAAQSNMGIWLRFPKPRWVGNVSAGFFPEGSRQFPVRVGDRTAHIPLRDFSGAGELENRGREHEFKFWLCSPEGRHEAVAAILRGENVGECLQRADAEAQRAPCLPEIEEASRDPVYLDLARANQLARLLTRLRRQARGPVRRVITQVRRKYRRARRGRPERNEDFVKDSLCLFAVLMEKKGGLLSTVRLSVRLISLVQQAFDDNPEMAKQLESDIANRCERKRGRKK